MRRLVLLVTFQVGGRRSKSQAAKDGSSIQPAPVPAPQAMFEEVSEIEIAELLYVRNLATTAI